MSKITLRLSTVAALLLITGACLRSQDAVPKYDYGKSVTPSDEGAGTQTPGRWTAEDALTRLDEDGDAQLSLAEYTDGYRGSAAIQRTTDVFGLCDRNGDGKLSLEELKTTPPQARFRRMDEDGDGGLSIREFYQGEMVSATPVQARRVFGLLDRNDDDTVSFEEFGNYSQEARLAKIDEDGDQELSLREFEKGHKDLAEGGRSQPAFAAMDQNGDGMLSVEEFAKRSQEVSFLFRDKDNDGKLNLEEFALWRGDQDAASIRTNYEKQDTDGDGLLTYREYVYDPADRDFWAMDEDGDGRVSWTELAGPGAITAAAAVEQPAQAEEEPRVEAREKTQRDERLRELFVEIDRNGDELINLEEYEARRDDLRFYCRDADRDRRLSIEEFKGGFDDTPEAIAEAEKLFRAKDRDGDARLTFQEFTAAPPRTTLSRLDANGDGSLDLEEFHQGDMAWASAERARAAFELLDRDKDGKLDAKECASRPNAAWFLRADTDEDGYCSFDEYMAVSGGPPRQEFCLRAFASMDRNGDGLLNSEEFCERSEEATFCIRDRDSDGTLTLEEYAAWSRTAEKIAEAQADFGRKDANGDERLDLREHLYRAADNDFWAADENGDLVVDLDELRKRMSVEDDEASVAELEEIFKTIDQNRDGGVSLAELGRQPADTRFQWFDLNQDAQLALEEFVGKLEDASAIAQAENSFQGRDKDGNGSLSVEEYRGEGN